MSEENVIYYSNPKIDFLFGLYGGKPIPTKQDKFAPIKVTQINEDGVEEKLNDFYVKKPDIDSVIEFNKSIQDVANKIFNEENIIRKPNEIEVIISISVTEKRFKEVDVDNLSKCVLDSLNKIAYEDDSQVSSLICNKHIHEMKLNAIFIGITKLTEKRRGIQGDIKLFGTKKWSEKTK
jgi:Holliday junction resolvase RusA-like endonuclease